MSVADIRRIRRLLRDAVPTLRIQTKNGNYPYDVVDDQEPEVLDEPSMSTNTMVAHALACLAGRIPESAVVGCRLSGAEDLLTESHRACLDNTVNSIVNQIRERARDRGADAKGPFDSPAFGAEDPFTMTWLLELLPCCGMPDGDGTTEAVRILRSTAGRRATAAFDDLEKPFLKFTQEDQSGRRKETALPHPLPLLRLMKIAQLLERDNDELRNAAFGWFRRRFEQQQSRRSLEHGGFDVAELVFCLEGMITATPGRVSRPVIDAVLSAIDQTHLTNPALRPTTPFKTTRSGGIHLFVSAEVIASLLRTSAALDRIGETDFFESLKPALHVYLSWLQASTISGKARPGTAAGADYYPETTPLTFVGWQSEHLHADDTTVNVWLTCQTILLLCAYHTLLSRSVAREALHHAGLEARYDRRSPEMDEANRRAAATADDPVELAEGSVYRTTSRLEEWFVGPRLGGTPEDASYSCLLYGPPGTGKTTLARRIAAELGWPLITVTTTDFMLDGENGVEARAKAIFEAFGAQSDSVVFFDEIDRLVLDRNAENYARQGDMLQFMTPSMLTKLNDLRARKRSIVILGTNYADRIDSAIKRPGRIDRRLLVLPPGLARRRAVLEEALGGSGELPETELNAAALAGAWQTIAELRSAARDFGKAGGAGGSLAEHVRAVEPAISLAPYKARMQGRAGADGASADSELDEEAFLLLYLLMEGNPGPVPREHKWLATQWDATGTRKARVVRDPDVVTALDQIVGRG